MKTMRKEYRPLSDDEKAKIERIKDLGEKFIDELMPQPGDTRVTRVGGPAREFSHARARMEEAVMWAVKGVTG